jgi:glycosyltransferase involved in cell wall biosynthesis
MFITVAICTWNRSRLLAQTLEGLRALTVPADVRWELLVVDNNSTDDTSAVIDRFAGVLPLTHIVERSQGHSHARNAAVAAARGELLVWTDDDVIVEPEWLEAYAEAASAFPSAAFFGGTVEPWFESEPPSWLAAHLDRLSVYVITRRSRHTAVLGPDEGIVGANMAFRTEVLRRFPFNTQLGRVEAGLIGGDDTELVERMKAAGHTGVWVGQAAVRHYIPSERLTRSYVRRWYVDAGRTHIRKDGVPAGAQLLGVPRWMLSEYLRNRLRALARESAKDERWCEAFRTAAILEGSIRESYSAHGSRSIGVGADSVAHKNS